MYLLFFTKTGYDLRHYDVGRLAEQLRSLGFFSLLAGMALVFLQVWFPVIPFVLVAGANVLVFGFGKGFAINYGMACLAALAAFVFARYVAYDRVEDRLSKYASFRVFSRRLERNAFFYTLLARLVPAIPSFVVNFGAGLSRVRLRPFVLATMIGKLPTVWLETMVGHDLLHWKAYKGRLTLLMALLAFLVGIGGFVKKIWLPDD